MGDVFRVTTRPLSVDHAFRAVRRNGCGAVDIFVGTVRDHHEGRRVSKLRYSAFVDMAEKEFSTIAREARRRWKLGGVYMAHRTGMLKPGVASVVLAVSSAHRAEAFAACRFAIERLKKSAPIWKEEFHARGKTWIAG